jgi:hypothetical protein
MLKTLAIISFLIAVAFVPLRSAHAQTLAYRVSVNIPFEFTVADETLPAGDYYIYRTQQYSSDNVLTISTVDGRVLAVQLTNGVQTLTPKKQGVLVFNRYGNKHFLSQVWIAGSNTGRAFLPSRSERELEREVNSIARQSGDKVRDTTTVSVVGGPQ